MHTWVGSLVDFAFLSAATGSTDLVRAEGAMGSCFPSFSLKKNTSLEDLIGEIRWCNSGVALVTIKFSDMVEFFLFDFHPRYVPVRVCIT